MKKLVPLTISIILSFMSEAQNINRIEPPCWWVGMKNSELQLMVHGKDIAQAEVNISYPGVELVSVDRVESPNYLFVNLLLDAEVKPSLFDITFSFANGKKIVHNYRLNERRTDSYLRQGFDASDVIYLLFPDRFANGNPDNDVVKGMLDKLDRKDLYARHGGDIQGIINHLDFFYLWVSVWFVLQCRGVAGAAKDVVCAKSVIL